MSSWDKTRNNYINWLSQNKLKDIFLKDLKYKGFSLWWATKLVDRDNINDDSINWYYNLHYVLNKKKINRNNINYFKLIFKLFKKFVKSLIFNLYVKIFLKRIQILKKSKIVFFIWYRSRNPQKNTLLIDNMVKFLLRIEKKCLPYKFK